MSETSYSCPKCGAPWKSPSMLSCPNSKCADIFSANICDDEKHIAAAMYLLRKAIVLREQPNCGWPTIHGCLRDAAFHCEAARQRWTKETFERMIQVEKEIFGEDKGGNSQ